MDAWRGARAVWQRMGVVLAAWRLGDFALAEQTARQILASAASNHRDRFFAYVVLWQLAMAQRDYATAVRVARETLDAGFHQVNEWRALIDALTAACHIAEAERAATDALREYPGHSDLVKALEAAIAAQDRCAGPGG